MEGNVEAVNHHGSSLVVNVNAGEPSQELEIVVVHSSLQLSPFAPEVLSLDSAYSHCLASRSLTKGKEAEGERSGDSEEYAVSKRENCEQPSCTLPSGQASRRTEEEEMMIHLDLDISQGELTPDMSIQIQEEDQDQEEDENEKEQEVEKEAGNMEEEEEDLATNAPSILLDTEELGSLSGRRVQPDRFLPELSSRSAGEMVSSHQAISIGEVLMTHVMKSEGEVEALSISSEAGDASVVSESSLSRSDIRQPSVEVRKSKRKSETNLLRSSHLGRGSASPPSSLSEGEWRASPSQMQRLYTMASAFGLLKDSNL
jgi:hypothetical protein